jgi:hypothetical protein
LRWALFGRMIRSWLCFIIVIPCDVYY